MKPIMSAFCFFLFLLALPNFNMAQNQKDLDKHWKAIEDLLSQDLPKSALKYYDTHFKNINILNKPDKIKASIYALSINSKLNPSNQYPIDSLKTIIQQESDPAVKSIWYSILAELYNDYYNKNYYNGIRGRTNLDTDTSQDLSTWSALQFVDTITKYYLLSFEEKELLQSIPIQEYETILKYSSNALSFMPTLYDLMTHRALTFFNNPNFEISKPIIQFEINEDLYFSKAEEFIKINLPSKTTDTTSHLYYSLQIFQDLMQFHYQSGHKAALVDIDLKRLKYVYERSISEDKNSLYFKGLEALYNANKEEPGVGIALYEMYKMQYDAILKSHTDSNTLLPDYAKTTMPDLVTKLRAISRNYSNTEVSANAQKLINDITSDALSIHTEHVLIPNQNFKALVSYKNINKVTLELYKMSAGDVATYNLNDEEIIKNVKRLKPTFTRDYNLKGTEDYLPHTTELFMEGLPVGFYVLTINDFNEKSDSALGSVTFQVSNLANITAKNINESINIVVNRTDGKPIEGALIKFYKYNEKSYIESITDLNGSYKSISQNYYRDLTLITHGNDTLISWSNREYKEQENEKSKQSTIFTDRSIYRPGQTVYFKGLVYTIGKDKGDIKINPKEKVTLSCYDANNQLVTALNLETNTYGSYHGKLTLPEGLLNGTFRLSDNYSTQYIKVEEYKRPKFYTEFDTLTTAYKLGDTLKLTGKAMAYAGNAISNAQVRYSVVRQTYFHYPWLRYYYWLPNNNMAKEIAVGQSTTDENGSFNITFDLAPDKSINPKTKPTFRYKVTAEVIDINGETHSASTIVSAGYDPYIITATIDEKVTLADLTSLIVSTQNQDGKQVAVPLQVSISKKKFPGFFRKRYWQKPDIQMFSLEEHRRLFPYDEYNNESDPYTWQSSQPLFEVKVKDASQPIQLPIQKLNENGYYLIQINGKGINGDTINYQKIVHLFDTALDSKPEQPIAHFINKSTLEPGELLIANFESVLANRYFRIISSNYKSGNFLNDNTSKIEKRIKESDRGGILYAVNLINNNRIYESKVLVEVPWRNKELDIKWATHRNKLLPGAYEEWRMTIKGNKKDAVTAELLSVLYDKSLDAIMPHSWSDLTSLFPYVNYYLSSFNYYYNFSNSHFFQWRYDEYDGLKENPFEMVIYPDITLTYLLKRSIHYSGSEMYSYRKSMTPLAMDAGAEPVAVESKSIEGDKQSENKTPEEVVETNDDEAIKTPLRSNFNETAYFYPQLKTNSEGDVVISFTLPESLTEWKMMAFAHTPDMKTGFIDGTILAQKDLMVQPNMPRFFRQKDKIVLYSKIVNLSDQILDGTVKLEIINPNTNQSLNLPFQLTQNEKPFKLAANSTSEVSWTLSIPESRYEPVFVRITAVTDKFTDGEEHLIPVLTNRTLITESLPLPMKGSGKRNFEFTRLLESNSNTLLHKSFTIEYTPNPAWYAVQALPYLQTYPYLCSEQTFNKYYATALAHKIVKEQPKIAQIFQEWKNKDTMALLSNLKKNTELKGILLKQTPWVLEANTESSQKEMISELFDQNNINKNLRIFLKQLKEQQHEDGGWPWFPGMRSNRYITQYILTGFGKLRNTQAIAFDNNTTQIVTKAIQYVDDQILKSYNELKKLNIKSDSSQSIFPIELHYLYMRSYFSDYKMDNNHKVAYDFYYNAAKKVAHQMRPYQKGQMALIAYRNKDQVFAEALIKSLKETSFTSYEMGMFWKNMPHGYFWYEAQIEAQALLIEAFTEITQDSESINDMKTWLLKQKQTQNWGTTTATADACYALLLKGDNWLKYQPNVHITAGTHSFDINESNSEAGTGYFKETLEGKEVTLQLGNISVDVDQPESSKLVSWGAAYWQYFEDMDKITGTNTPLSISKKLYVKKHTNQGEKLFEVNGQNSLKMGDRITVRIILKVDRDMEYIHLKDMRAAAFEPVDALSGYNYNNGIGYYRSIKDASIDFFFDHINTGTYVFEYDMFVNAKGNYSNGISTVQCMYAPEFRAHTEGIRVEIE